MGWSPGGAAGTVMTNWYTPIVFARTPAQTTPADTPPIRTSADSVMLESCAATVPAGAGGSVGPQPSAYNTIVSPGLTAEIGKPPITLGLPTKKRKSAVCASTYCFPPKANWVAGCSDGETRARLTVPVLLGPFGAWSWIGTGPVAVSSGRMMPI